MEAKTKSIFLPKVLAPLPHFVVHTSPNYQPRINEHLTSIIRDVLIDIGMHKMLL